MKHFVLEIILVVIFFGIPFAMLETTRHTRFARWNLTPRHKYLLALFAWIPVGVMRFLWHPVTAHHARHIPIWLVAIWWLLLIAGIVLVFMSGSFLKHVQWIGGALVVILAIFAGWFAPNGKWWHVHSPWSYVLFWAIVLLVLALVVFLVWRVGVVAIVIALVGVALVASSLLGGVMGSTGHNSPKAANPSATASSSASASSASSASSSASASAAAVNCPTWAMSNILPDNGNWFQEGAPAIADAQNDAQARKALLTWINDTKNYPVLLEGAKQFLLNQDVDKATLVDSKGCATDTAVALAQQLSLEATKYTVHVADAPANGINSGTSNGTVVVSSSPGISGDRKAIQVILPDGTSVWIMARCGNPVTLAPRPLPTAPPSSCVNGCPKSPSPTPSNSTTSSSPTPTPTPTKSSPTPTPTPSKTSKTPPPSTKTTTTPPPPPSPPIIVNVVKINDLHQGGFSDNFCITVQAQSGDNVTISLTADYGHFSASSFTGSNLPRECVIYYAPNDSTAKSDLTETVTVTLRDNTTGQTATPNVQQFLIHPVFVNP